MGDLQEFLDGGLRSREREAGLRVWPSPPHLDSGGGDGDRLLLHD